LVIEIYLAGVVERDAGVYGQACADRPLDELEPGDGTGRYSTHTNLGTGAQAMDVLEIDKDLVAVLEEPHLAGHDHGRKENDQSAYEKEPYSLFVGHQTPIIA
jgi:hypothetical protein